MPLLAQVSRIVTCANNVCSWLKSTVNPLFEQTLYYNDGDMPSYNGNISKNEWLHDGKGGAYTYRYDELNRLLSAEYAIPAPSAHDRYTGFGTSYTYDRQGNIKTLQRKSTWNNPESVDELVLTYQGNQLYNVLESGDPFWRKFSDSVTCA